VSGYAIWGLSPLFYMLLDFTSAAEIVLHRAIWSAPVSAGDAVDGETLGRDLGGAR
jgi:EamA domain-containing membrane protein RarD